MLTRENLQAKGGLIVIDFIDMAPQSHRQKLSRFLEKTLKERDKFQSVTLKISEFGLVQMTRKRSGKTLVQQLTNVCSSCNGSGFVKSIPSISYQILRQAREEIQAKKLSGPISLSISSNVFDYLVNNEYRSIIILEKQLGCKVILEKTEHYEDKQFVLKKA
jgi:Ribonuclease G/E